VSFRITECGNAKPSKIGTECVTPSPESKTTPVVRPVEYLCFFIKNLFIFFFFSLFYLEIQTYKLRTACIDIYKAGTLNDSKNISAAFSRFRRGFKGASVSKTGCFFFFEKF